MQQILSATTLENRLPIYGIENDCILSKYGDITLAFRVDLPEVFALSSEEYELLHSKWCKAIRLLPDFSIVHKQDWFFTQNYRPENKEEGTFLSKSFQQHFLERPFLSHTCYVYLSKSNKTNMRKESLATTLARGKIAPKKMSHRSEVKAFMDSVAQFVSIMEENQITSFTRMKASDILGTPTQKGLLDSYFTLDNTSNCVLQDIRIEADAFIVGDKHTCVHSISDVDDLPSHVRTDSQFEKLSSENGELFLSFAAPLGLGLSCDHIYNQYIFIDNSNENLQKLDAAKRRMYALSKYSHANEINSDFIDEYVNMAHREGLRSVRAHQNIFAFSGDKNELEKIKTDVGTAITQMNCNIRHNTNDVPILFWAGIPGNAADFPSEDTYHTFIEQGACFFCNETNFADSLSPFGIKMTDRFTGKPLHIDISDEPMRQGIITNRNKFILGPSGSGKSFFTNHLVRQYYEQGTHIVLIDIGNSYLGLCQLIKQNTRGKDGVYITYTDEKPIAFNPFYVESGSFDFGKIEMIKALLFVLWKREDEKIRRSDEVAISNMVFSFVKKIEDKEELHPCFNSFYEYVRTVFSQELLEEKVSTDDFNLSNFLFSLKPFYKGGEYDYLLNCDKTIDLLNKRFVVFELDNIKEHKILFPVVTIIIMETFLHKLFTLKGQRKMILIEEAWKAITKEDMAEYIKYLFKTVRKHFGEAVVVTQEIDDIINNPIVKDTIINNSDCKILMDSNKYQKKFPYIQTLLGLNEKQKSQILSINKNLDPTRKYKEVFISLGEKVSNVYATEVSTEEYYLYTTEEPEKLILFTTAAKYGGDIELALKELSSQNI